MQTSKVSASFCPALSRRKLQAKPVPGNPAAGFTLIEVLVVVAILGLLAAMVVPNIIGKGDQAKIDIAKTELAAIGNALDLYKLDNHRYPTTDQGIEALQSKPDLEPEPKNYQPGGYIKKKLEDPWGNPYQYLSEGSSFELFSLGADGEEGGAGDAADISYQDI